MGGWVVAGKICVEAVLDWLFIVTLLIFFGLRIDHVFVEQCVDVSS